MQQQQGRAWCVCALLLAGAALPQAARAQTATISGTLSAFDIVNETGLPAHGFEIQLEGAFPGDLYYTVLNGRYGNPTVVPYATGVYVRWQSAYNSATQQFSATTPAGTVALTSWQDCYLGGAGYATSGCEHLGQSMKPIPAPRVVTVTGRWLVEDSANPGTLIAANPPAAIPFANWSVAVSTTFAAAPVVVAQVEAPEPPPTPEVYGDAQWVKIYKTQSTQPVTGDQLTFDNSAVVPEASTQIEVAWDILQASPPSNSNGNQTRNRKQNQGSIAADTRSVVRRYELYKYTGAYDATTHQVVCADGTCTAPSAGELGPALSAQNTATNVTADSVGVTKTGNGAVTGVSGKISCGNACATFATNGSSQSLTAAAASGAAFAGWTGACDGVSSATCAITVNGQMSVGATFKTLFTLSVGRSNPGTVQGSPAGNDRTLDCGSACSAKFLDGTAVTLTAIPPAGKTFVNWSGGCSGTAPTCTVTISKDTSVQAVFSK